MPRPTHSRQHKQHKQNKKIATEPLLQLSTLLLRHYGQQNWWPARNRFEVIIGAYLTQNTKWMNVEKAMSNLRRAGKLSVAGIRQTPISELEQLIRPAGYFRQKAERLKIFVRFLDENYAGSLARLFSLPVPTLRQNLLELKGVGPETADSIILYAAGKPSFVVDAYTRRILERHNWAEASTPYDDIKAAFESALAGGSGSGIPAHDPRHPPSQMSRLRTEPTAQLYNEVHAVIVRVGNAFCRSKANCDQCPLRVLLPAKGAAR